MRGGILDLFPWHTERPLRFEFFDTEIESIREFDLDSQSSQSKMQFADLLLEDVAQEAQVSDFRQTDDLVIHIASEPPATASDADILILEGAGNRKGVEDFSNACYGRPFGHFEAGDFILQESLRERFFSQLAEWRRDDWMTGIVFSNQGEQERFAELLPMPEKDRPTFLTGTLMESFTMPEAKLALLSSSEIFGRYQTQTLHTHPARQRANSARSTVEEFEPDDLVVHSEYGIGRFIGIQPSDEGNDEITIEFRDGAQLAVPVDQAHLVAKYVGLGGRTPQLSKLGGQSWRAAGQKAEQTVMDYAARLLAAGCSSK